MTACLLSGLTILKKTMFQTIIPKEKNRIANPDTLLRSFGNYDQRQFMMGIALIAKHIIGTNRKNTPNVTKFKLMFKRRGTKVKSKAHNLIILS